MPLTAEEKNQIAQGAVAVGQVALAPTISAAVTTSVVTGAATGSFLAGGSAALISFLPAIGLILPAIGLLNLFGPRPFPQGPTGREIFDPIDILRARGLDPRISRDPFFGDLVISTRDQDPFLDELVRNSAVNRVAARTDFSDVLAFREGVVEGLAETAQERGFAREIDPSFRGGVFRETADAPLQLVERALP